jgi:hypothetical protein
VTRVPVVPVVGSLVVGFGLGLLFAPSRSAFLADDSTIEFRLSEVERKIDLLSRQLAVPPPTLVAGVLPASTVVATEQPVTAQPIHGAPTRSSLALEDKSPLTLEEAKRLGRKERRTDQELLDFYERLIGQDPQFLRMRPPLDERQRHDLLVVLRGIGPAYRDLEDADSLYSHRLSHEDRTRFMKEQTLALRGIKQEIKRVVLTQQQLDSMAQRDSR